MGDTIKGKFLIKKRPGQCDSYYFKKSENLFLPKLRGQDSGGSNNRF